MQAWLQNGAEASRASGWADLAARAPSRRPTLPRAPPPPPAPPPHLTPHRKLCRHSIACGRQLACRHTSTHVAITQRRRPCPRHSSPSLTCDAARPVSHREDALLVVEGRVQPLHLSQLQHCKGPEGRIVCSSTTSCLPTGLADIQCRGALHPLSHNERCTAIKPPRHARQRGPTHPAGAG